jgi:Cu(I)/Ag(I) efflux system protein CusF
MLAGVLTTLLSFAEVRAQGMQQKNMDRMPGMGGTKQETTASATGTVTAVNSADRKITFNHGPIPEIKMASYGPRIVIRLKSTDK